MVPSSRLQLVEYFKRNISKGYDSDTLKWSLINQGYSRSLVEFALKDAQKELSKKVPAFKEKPRISYQILDEDDKPIRLKKPWWKRFFSL